MTKEQLTHQERVISGALSELINNSNFEVFMDVLRAQREVVIDDLCSDEVIGNERATMAAVGELRTYKSILALYAEHKARQQV